MSVFRKAIIKIIKDRRHGSSELLDMIIDLLNEHRNSLGIGELKWTFDALRRIDQSMATIHHFIESLSSSINEHFFDHFEAYIKHWENVGIRIRHNFEATESLANTTILTHSRSGTIIKLLNIVEQKPDKIYQTRSMPGAEGELQAQALLEGGHEVEIIADSTLSEVIPLIDMCLLGCDQYTADAFINKIGSRAIVSAAHDFEKPVIVVTDSRKKVKQLNPGGSLFEIVEMLPNVKLISDES